MAAVVEQVSFLVASGSTVQARMQVGLGNWSSVKAVWKFLLAVHGTLVLDTEVGVLRAVGRALNAAPGASVAEIRHHGTSCKTSPFLVRFGVLGIVGDVGVSAAALR